MGFQHIFRPVHRLAGHLFRVRRRDQFRRGLFPYLEGQGVAPYRKVVFPSPGRLQSILHRGVLGKMAFLLLIQKMFKWNVVWCNLLALCVSGGLNFFMSERVVFRKKKALPSHDIEFED